MPGGIELIYPNWGESFANAYQGARRTKLAEESQQADAEARRVQLEQAKAEFDYNKNQALAKAEQEKAVRQQEQTARLHGVVAQRIQQSPQSAEFYAKALDARGMLPSWAPRSGQWTPEEIQRFSTEASGAGAVAGVDAPAVTRDPRATEIELGTGMAPNTPEARAEYERRRQAEADAAAAKNARDRAGKVTDAATSLRKEWQQTPTYKYQKEIDTAVQKLEGSSANGAGDMSLVYAYMKIQDASTGVKEGEYANAQNAGGIPDWVRNAYNKTVNGQFLTPEQRENFRAEGRRMAGDHRNTFAAEAKRYRDLATEQGANPDHVALMPAAQSGAPGGKPQADLFTADDLKTINGGP